MTLYDLIKSISAIITPDTNALYNYVLYTSDDIGGYLRTRYCWWDTPVKNRKIADHYDRVFVASMKPINIKELEDTQSTNVKLQIAYCFNSASFDDAEWSSELGYCYIYVFDLNSQSYTLVYRKSPYT